MATAVGVVMLRWDWTLGSIAENLTMVVELFLVTGLAKSIAGARLRLGCLI